jgi:hypothetical protein
MSRADSGTEPGDDDRERAADAWEAVGHRQAWLQGEERRADVDEAMGRILVSLQENDPIDADAVRDAREQVDYLRDFIERVAAELADGVEPWDEGAGRMTPNGVFREHLAGEHLPDVGGGDESDETGADHGGGE